MDCSFSIVFLILASTEFFVIINNSVDMYLLYVRMHLRPRLHRKDVTLLLERLLA